MITLDAMRRFAVARSLFASTTLKRALDRFGFERVDPFFEQIAVNDRRARKVEQRAHRFADGVARPKAAPAGLNVYAVESEGVLIPFQPSLAYRRRQGWNIEIP